MMPIAIQALGECTMPYCAGHGAGYNMCLNQTDREQYQTLQQSLFLNGYIAK